MIYNCIGYVRIELPIEAPDPDTAEALMLDELMNNYGDLDWITEVEEKKDG